MVSCTKATYRDYFHLTSTTGMIISDVDLACKIIQVHPWMRYSIVPYFYFILFQRLRHCNGTFLTSIFCNWLSYESSRYHCHSKTSNALFNINALAALMCTL
jgi:hypothetical protein